MMNVPFPRLLLSPCPVMISSLQHERRRIGEAITQLQASQRILDTMLAAVRRRAATEDDAVLATPAAAETFQPGDPRVDVVLTGYGSPSAGAMPPPVRNNDDARTELSRHRPAPASPPARRHAPLPHQHHQPASHRQH
ncbi:MAG: hypothetical protein JOY82_17610 [Streptosporangiaceae bacterium]|nr:hypothetical protein [Streptosporangiaceae bacterium]MBV9856307.1 hypothetical protein [Streptosporangiaceae bacterium]